MIDPSVALGISVMHGVDESVYAEILVDFERAHFPVSVERRNLECFASLQYLIPTAFVVYVFKPYAEKFLSLLAEDNYNSCKSALKKLWSTCIAEDRTVRSQFIATKGKVHESELGADLSFVVRTSDEQYFRLLFPKGMAATDFQIAIVRFYALIEEHDRDPETSVLKTTEPISHRSRHQRILTWAAEGRLVEVDVMESAQRKMLITLEIPNLLN